MNVILKRGLISVFFISITPFFVFGLGEFYRTHPLLLISPKVKEPIKDISNDYTDMKGTAVLHNVSSDKQKRDYVSEIDELNNAMTHGNVDKVKELIAKGVDVNRENRHGETPLFKAMEYYMHDKAKKTDIVKLLIEAKADINKDTKGTTPLTMAITMDDIALVKLLLMHGTQHDAIKEEVFLSVIQKNNPELTRLLIEHGNMLFSSDTVVKWWFGAQRNHRAIKRYIVASHQVLRNKKIDGKVHQKIRDHLKDVSGKLENRYLLN